MATPPIVVVGLGQMGGAFAHALLRSGHTITPWTRSSPADDSVRPALVLVATGESDLADAVRALPVTWRDRVALLQNELLPSAWTELGLESPTVAVVWFEKKADKPIHVIRSTPIAGPHAGLLVDALASLDIAAHVLPSDAALVSELVLKNLYILTANIGGLTLPDGATVGQLWDDHRELAEAIARDALSIQRAEVGKALKAKDEELIEELEAAFDADPAHGAKGRSAPDRLHRALALAARHGLKVPAMNRIAGGLA